MHTECPVCAMVYRIVYVYIWLYYTYSYRYEDMFHTCIFACAYDIQRWKCTHFPASCIQLGCYTTLLIVVGSIYCIFIYLQTIFLIYFLHEDLKNPSCSTHNAWREQAYMNIMWHSVDILGRCRFSLERPWLNTRYKLRLLAQSEMKPLQLDDIKSQKMS